MKKIKKKGKLSAKVKKLSLRRGYNALYERKYLYFLGIMLLVILLIIVIKILPSFAKQLDVPAQPIIPLGSSENVLNCAHSQITDRDALLNNDGGLKSKFGITLTGSLGSGVDRALEIYNTMCKLNEYNTFFSMIRANGRKVNLTIDIRGDYKCGSGFTPNRNTIYMGWCPSQAENRFIMVHEMGHVIRYRNDNGRGGTVFSNFAKNVYHDLKCSGNFDTCSTNLYDHPSPNRLKTENCYFAGYYYINSKGKKVHTLGTWMESECFSDMIGEFLVYNSFIYRVSSGANPSAIRSQYTSDGWYSFAENNIFGDSSSGIFDPNEFGIKSSTTSTSTSTTSYKAPVGTAPKPKPVSTITYKYTSNPCAYARCGNGYYCWNASGPNASPKGNNCLRSGNTIYYGASNRLYKCSGGKVVATIQYCSYGCYINPSGADKCSTKSTSAF